MGASNAAGGGVLRGILSCPPPGGQDKKSADKG